MNYILVEILRHSGLVVLSPLSTAVGQNFKQSLNKTTADIQTVLPSRGYTISMPACTITFKVMQLVSSHPTIILSYTNELHSVLHARISCNLYFMVISSAVLFMVCMYTTQYIQPPLQNAGACLQQFTNVMPHCIKPLASFISFPILL